MKSLTPRPLRTSSPPSSPAPTALACCMYPHASEPLSPRADCRSLAARCPAAVPAMRA